MSEIDEKALEVIQAKFPKHEHSIVRDIVEDYEAAKQPVQPDERTAFEAWAHKFDGTRDEFNLGKNTKGEYVWSVADMVWRAWQAGIKIMGQREVDSLSVGDVAQVVERGEVPNQLVAEVGGASPSVPFPTTSPMRESGWVEGKPVTLKDCEPGLFRSKDGWLGLKTEYKTPISKGLFTHYYPEAFVVESGEYWWGGTNNHEDREKQIVIPVSVKRNDVEDGAVHG